jgi:hypothetical protein
MERIVVREHANEDDGARHRQRDAEHDFARQARLEMLYQHCTEEGRDQTLRHGTGNRDPPDGEPLFDMKLEADANISRITPISASCSASAGFATNPGVFGPSATPASRYPTIGDSPIR